MQEKMSIFILSQTHHSNVVPARAMCMFVPAELAPAGLGCLPSPKPQLLMLPKLPPTAAQFLNWFMLYTATSYPVVSCHIYWQRRSLLSFPLELLEKTEVHS